MNRRVLLSRIGSIRPGRIRRIQTTVRTLFPECVPVSAEKGRRQELAGDLTQQVFLKALLNIPRYEIRAFHSQYGSSRLR